MRARHGRANGIRISADNPTRSPTAPCAPTSGNSSLATEAPIWKQKIETSRDATATQVPPILDLDHVCSPPHRPVSQPSFFVIARFMRAIHKDFQLFSVSARSRGMPNNLAVTASMSSPATVHRRAAGKGTQVGETCAV